VSRGARRFLAVGLLAAAGSAAAGAWWFGHRPPVVEVTPADSLAAIVERVPEGTVVRLLPGTHGPLELTRRVVLEGGPGARVRGPVTVLADGVELRNLQIRGGSTGVDVRHAQGVLIEDVTVIGADLHGIEVADGGVTVLNCTIAGLTSPYAQAFEIRNANGRPRSVVEGCTVSEGREGLVSHVSRVEFRNNTVTGTTLRAIAVTEMSEGLVEGNLVTGVAGVAVFCGDMSHCDVRDNVVRGVEPNPSAGKSHEGYGAVAWYYSRMRLQGNSFSVSAPQPVRLAIGSGLTDEIPMGIWPPGWKGALPGVAVSVAALAGLAAVRATVAPWVRRRRRSRLATSPKDGSGGQAISPRVRDLLLVGFLVQTFHMLEHGVQVFQVYVADAETRSGLAGAVADTEWVHFLYNTGVLAFLVWAWWVLRRATPMDGLRQASSASLLAAAVIQIYHQVEHTTKLIQHLATGVDPAPGLVGQVVDLVWFHYGINLAVYAGIVLALAPWLGDWVRGWIARVSGRSQRVELRPRELDAPAR
jgi:hypothetical protein